MSLSIKITFFNPIKHFNKIIFSPKMEIFDEFIVVEEKVLTNLIFNGSGDGNGNSSTLGDLTQFDTIEFKIDNIRQTLEIADIGNDFASDDVPLAQIVQWEWEEKMGQVIRETKILKINGKLEFDINFMSSFVIRILKKKAKNDQNLGPPLNSPDDDLTVQIGEEKITVSAHWLIAHSSVIQQKLSVEMKEKQQQQINLDELGVDMEQFKDFLGYISPIALREQILPNPKNLAILLKLSDYFQVNWLKKCCADHLINCVEIALFDRLVLIERFRLNSFENYFFRFDVDKLYAFHKINHTQLFPFISKEFLLDLIHRFLNESKMS